MKSGSENCGTPAECYIKAIAILQKDRDEMRASTDRTRKEFQNDGLIGYFEGNCPKYWEEYYPASGRFIISAGYYSAHSSDGREEVGTYNLGSIGGEINHKLYKNEMPQHNHRDGDFRFLLKSDCSNTMPGSVDVTCGEPNLHEAAILIDEGGDAPHNNIPPYIALKACRKTKLPYHFQNYELKLFTTLRNL